MAKSRRKKRRDKKRKKKNQIRTRPLPKPRLRSVFDQFIKNYSQGFTEGRRTRPLSLPSYNSTKPLQDAPKRLGINLVTSPKTQKTKTHTLTSDDIPNTVCKNRQIRKEIVHAKNIAGQSGQKKPSSINRNIKC